MYETIKELYPMFMVHIFDITIIAIVLFIVYGLITFGYRASNGINNEYRFHQATILAFFDSEIPETFVIETLPKKRDHLMLFLTSPFEYIDILYEQYKNKERPKDIIEKANELYRCECGRYSRVYQIAFLMDVETHAEPMCVHCESSNVTHVPKTAATNDIYTFLHDFGDCPAITKNAYNAWWKWYDMQHQFADTINATDEIQRILEVYREQGPSDYLERLNRKKTTNTSKAEKNEQVNAK